MGDRSKIEWTDASWTPIRAVNRATGKAGWHCEHVSPGCKHCYAEAMNHRLGTGLEFKPGHVLDVEIRLDPGLLEKPLRWARPRMIFVCSMTDLFGEFVPTDVIDYVFAVMALSPRHTFQVVTKRSARMRAYLCDPATVRRVYEAACDLAVDLQLTNVVLVAPGMPADVAPAGPRVHLDTWPLPNVWVGVSTEDQPRLDERAPDLIAAPAAVRFLSAEPLLGRIDARVYMPNPLWNGLSSWKQPELDWVIVGGESGLKARLMHPDWARGLRDQCAAAGVPFFFKQWGAWKPICAMADGEADTLYRSRRVAKEGESQYTVDEFHGRRCIVPVESIGFGGALGLDAFFMVDGHGGMTMFNVGKKLAGRLLDGVEHNGTPDRTPAPAGAA